MSYFWFITEVRLSPEGPEASIPGKEDHGITSFHSGLCGHLYAIFLAPASGKKQVFIPSEER